MRRIAILAGLVVHATAAAAQSGDAEVARATERLTPHLVEVRHDLHQHPELSNRETRTGTFVAGELRRLGLEVRTGVARTGVIGVLKGARPGPTVAVRADMDALPVVEQGDLPWRSTVTTTYAGRDVGVSHVCGHDMHVAVALGVAEVLAGMRERLAGTVVFVFQPAEEGAPAGEEGGARLMIKEGVLREYKPDIMLALHTNGAPPEQAGDFERAGLVSYSPGAAYSASTTWRARIVGRSSHGASPHLGVDAIVAASQAVLALQTIRSRNVDPQAFTVLTVGVLRAGERHNIVAGDAVLEGTIRTFSDSLSGYVRRRMEEILRGTTEAAGAGYELEFPDANPVTMNDPALVARFAPVLQRALGRANVAEAPPITASEDFAWFAREVPSFYFQLGVVGAGHVSGGHHTPTFRADDEAIPVGVRAMSALVLDYLRGKGK